MAHEVDASEGLILAIDQFLHPKVFHEVAEDVKNLQGWIPETDHPDLPPVGASCDIDNGTRIQKEFSQELKKMFAAPWKVARFFINRFEAKEVPQFHRDHNAITCILYADEAPWSFDDHGETQLLVNGEVRGILPMPNRLLVFDGNLMHRATSFQTRVRHTISLQMDDVSFDDIVLPGSNSQKFVPPQ